MKRVFHVACCLGAILTTSMFAAASATPVDANLRIWLDSADRTTILDDDGDNALSGAFDGTIQNWNDKSGNASHGTALNADLPNYNTGTPLNGQGVVRFNNNPGTEAFSFPATVNSSRETMFFMIRMFDNGDNRGAWVSAANNEFLNDNDRYWLSVNGQEILVGNSATTTFQAVTQTRDPAIVGLVEGRYAVYEDGVAVVNQAGNNADPYTGTFGISRLAFTVDDGRYYWGEMAEVLIYQNETLNTAKRVITENYLNAKWESAPLAANDFYAGDTAANGHHDFDVLGIGQAIASTVSPAGDHTSSSGDAISLVELNSSLDNGDYMLAGHATTAHGLTIADVPATATNRWTRDYYLDVTGIADARLTFDFSLAGLGTPTGSYTLLYRTGTSGFYTDLFLPANVSGSTVSFDLLGYSTLNDGFYTIAEVPVPEPSTVGLLTIGLAMMVGRRRLARN